MQTESVTVLFSGKTVIENASQIVLRNPNSIIHDRDLDSAVTVCHSHGQPLVGAA
jgi:hypothetical protein